MFFSKAWLWAIAWLEMHTAMCMSRSLIHDHVVSFHYHICTCILELYKVGYKSPRWRNYRLINMYRIEMTMKYSFSKVWFSYILTTRWVRSLNEFQVFMECCVYESLVSISSKLSSIFPLSTWWLFCLHYRRWSVSWNPCLPVLVWSLTASWRCFSFMWD